MVKREIEIRKRWNGSFTMTSVSKKMKPLDEKPIFVIQWHKSIYPHFDLRLELNHEILKSWILPENVFTNSNIESEAILTNDHYLPWAYFEGFICEGKYSKGTVMVWDIGKYECPSLDYNINILNSKKYDSNSSVSFKLYGKKIEGNFLLQYKGKYNGHFYWNFKRIRNESDDRANLIVPFNVSALSGSTIEDIRKETANAL